MKKLSIILMIVLIFVCILSGCGNSESTNTSDVKENNKSIGELCAENIPNPEDYFKDKNIDIAISNDLCTYEIEGDISKNEFSEYINACKKAGFTRVSVDDSNDEMGMYLYYAYDEGNEYFLNVDYYAYGDEDDTIYIVCKKNTETNNNETEN